jgi:predicted MFS family arabinose efflux permease
MNFFTYIFMALGGALGEFLYDNVSPQSSVLLTIILVIPSTLIALIYIREPKPEERQA